MDDTHELYDASFRKLVDDATNHPIESKEATDALKNLKIFSECRPPTPEPQPESTPEPTTFWGKTRLGLARALDNETTRVFIKAGGAFAGVALIAYSTIHRDHVIERQALSQANQRND
jgi:hypothetical protein